MTSLMYINMVYLVLFDLLFFQSEDLLVILDTSGALVVYSGTTKVGNLDSSTMDEFTMNLYTN